MKLKNMLAAAVLMAFAWSVSAATETEKVKAAQELLASMQAEKMMRMTAGMSRYANDQQRQAVMAKLEQVAPQEIYRRLAAPVSRLVTPETASEMTRFYSSSYGKKVLHDTYNSKPSLIPSERPRASAAERAELKRAAYIKADKEFKAAEPAIRHEMFVLLGAIVNKRN